MFKAAKAALSGAGTPLRRASSLLIPEKNQQAVPLVAEAQSARSPPQRCEPSRSHFAARKS
jgi:hypothetical protein